MKEEHFDLRQQLQEKFLRECDDEVYKLVWRMIGNGQFFHNGWTISYRFVETLTGAKFECWSVPPQHA